MNPLWTPSPELIENSLIKKFMRFVGGRADIEFQGYEDFHRYSVESAEDFWNALWDFCDVIGDKGMEVIRPMKEVPYARFFPDSKINYTENALDQARMTPGAPAIISRIQDGKDRIITWQELTEQVSLWEQALTGAGLKEGDHIGVYLSNLPETVIIFLAAANLGIVFSSAGMEMGGDDLVGRFSQIKPKLLITASGYVHGAKTISRVDIIDRIKKEIPSINKIIVLGHDEKLYMSSKAFLAPHKPKPLIYKRRDFNHPLYILFSSGTTGKPKCFEHSTGGILLKHLCEYQLHCDVKPGDRVFYHATPSWMMWNWLASGLASGATILMYDGSPAHPDVYAQWTFTSAHKCTHHGTAAPVILSWEKAGIDLKGRCDVSDLRVIMSTGAILPEQGYRFIHKHIKDNVKISSISGGTDIVGCFVGGNPLTPTYAGQTNNAMLGCDVHVWDENGKEMGADEAGELVCTNAFPSMPLQFLNDPDRSRYADEYFNFYPDKKVWRHGDSIKKTQEGQLLIIGRSDATLNQNGVRIGPAVIYDQLIPYAKEIADFAAVDFTRPDNKQAITILFLTPEKDEISEELKNSIKTAVRNNVTPYAVPTEIISVPGILKTPNGKKAEVVIKKILAGKNIPNPALYGENLVKLYEDIGLKLQEKYAEQAA